MNNALNDFIFQSKYARYNPSLGRKETFEESVGRIEDMHIKFLGDKYPHVFESAEFNSDFIEAMQAYRDGKVYGSQRGLQFGGEPVLRKHARLFNCSFTYVDRLEVFKQVEWVLLTGCGVGLSVEYKHVDKLPRMIDDLSNEVETVVIGDSIEAWSEAFERLLNYYFVKSTSYPKFDYSAIRPKGSLISGGFLAPGPDGLRNSIDKIRDLLDKVHKTTKKLSPINCTDILSHEADSVLSGGVRRSALSILFSPEDEEMFNAKTGNWFYTQPQRARFNASAALEREGCNREVFDRLFVSTKQFGEPGFFFRSHPGLGTNPCQPAWAPVITPEGLSTIGDIKEGDKIWSESGWTTVVKKWSTGIKPVYKYTTTGGTFYGTENHKLISKGKKVEAKDCETVDSLSGELFDEEFKHDPQLIMDGLVLGDGYAHRASNNLIGLLIGDNDYDYHNSEIKPLIKEHRPGVGPKFWTVKTNITSEELHVCKPNISIPKRYFKLSKRNMCSFLRGLYTANGSVVSNRITYKTSSSKLRDDIQLMLSYLGISSYYTTNKPAKVKFSNGEYVCKESYDVNITTDRERFVKLIGFIQKYKNEKITIKPTKKDTKSRPIKEVILLGEEEVFDITVDNPTHTYWTGGLNVSNCFEIGFVPVTSSGETGFQFCNLVSISGKSIFSEEDFYTACKNASTIATIQAGYQEFPFLGEVTEQLVREDPLIGVSISGIMMNPDILLNPKVLRRGADIVKEQNTKVATIMGIREASRTCTVKPDGSFSTLTGNSPGCHGAHAKRYIRRVQVNKEEEAGKIYKKYNPKSVVESVWSTNNTDDCIMFAIEEDDNTVYKSDLFGLKQLEVVKTLYNNWIVPGNRIENNPIQNNVSNTVMVPDGEWDNVRDYIWENRKFLAGVSLIAVMGELDFTQPPYTEVLLPSELISKYGEGIIFASGLIVDAEKVFGNLWKACDTFKGLGEKLYSSILDAKNFIKELNVSEDPQLNNQLHSQWVEAKKKQYSNWYNVLLALNYSEEFIEEILDGDFQIPIAEVKKYLDQTQFQSVKNLNEKRDIMRRMKKYGDKYFNSDYQLMINALKSVQLYHDWCDITMNYTPIDWTKVKWENVLLNADEMAGASCSGGACDITKL